MLTDEQLQETVYHIFFHIKKYDKENKYANWSAGITNDPDKREIKHKNKSNIKYFKSWNLENKTTANFIVNYLIENGFKNCKSEFSIFNSIGSYFDDAVYVYVYKNDEYNNSSL